MERNSGDQRGIYKKKVFNGVTTKPNKLVEEIKEETFDWISKRSKIQGLTWNEWRSFSFLE
ncbi:hypothetical protein Hdeb2414_s0013g00405311 [Helianthus debilis subsp. tardiflorus]